MPLVDPVKKREQNISYNNKKKWEEFEIKEYSCFKIKVNYHKNYDTKGIFPNGTITIAQALWFDDEPKGEWAFRPYNNSILLPHKDIVPLGKCSEEEYYYERDKYNKECKK